jgi:DNA repair protein RecO (recombination protein O)
MPVLTSEAVVLRTWPVHESDLIVSFFTRDYGRMKGVAKAALKSRKRFGGTLEPMTLARAWFAERPRQELVRLDQLEILRSPLSRPVDAARLATLSFYAELLDEILPEHDPQDAVYRLIVSVLEQTTAAQSDPAQPNIAQPSSSQTASSGPQALGPRASGPQASGPWMPLTYFSLWMTRLMGLLPDIAYCIVCHEPLNLDALHAAEISFNSYADGLFCGLHRSSGSAALSEDSWQLAQRMLRAPVSTFASEPWPRRRAQDLRRFTLQVLERHLERKLRSADALARLGG